MGAWCVKSVHTYTVLRCQLSHRSDLAPPLPRTGLLPEVSVPAQPEVTRSIRSKPRFLPFTPPPLPLPPGTLLPRQAPVLPARVLASMAIPLLLLLWLHVGVRRVACGEERTAAGKEVRLRRKIRAATTDDGGRCEDLFAIRVDRVGRCVLLVLLENDERQTTYIFEQ